MTSVTESVDVKAPISAVYNQWTQFESFPKFMSGVEQVTQADDRHTHWVTRVGGADREFDAEITEQHPEERVAWKSTDGTTHAGVITFHRLGEQSTRVTAQIDWQPEGVVEKAGAVLGFDNRQVQSDLQRFKEFIEARGSETGGWRGDVPAGSYKRTALAGRAPGGSRKIDGSDMTEPDRDPLSRAQKLESVVDDLDDKIASEREAEGVPGNPSDREHDAAHGGPDYAEHEPPD